MSTEPFAPQGYAYLAAGNSDLTNRPIFGFTTLQDTVVSSITHPSIVDGNPYNGDPTDLVGKTLPGKVFYPLPATAITLSSGSALGWIDTSLVPPLAFDPLTFPMAFFTDAESESIANNATGLPLDFSSNGRHTSQVTAANRPTFKTGGVAGYPFKAWSFDSTDVVATPSFQAFPSKRGAIFALVQHTAVNAAQVFASTWNGTAPNWQIYSSVVSATPYKWADGTLRNASGPSFINRWTFDMLIRTSDTNMELWRNGVKLQDIAIGDLQMASNPMYIGGVSIAANFPGGRLAALGIFDGVMSNEQRDAIHREFVTDRNLVNIVHDGASNTWGLSNGLTQGQPWPDVLQTISDRWVYGHNVAVAGQTTQNIIDGAAANVDTKYNPLAQHNIVTFGDNMGNDFFNGLSAADTFTKAEAYIAARHAEGWKVGIITPTPQSNPALTPPDFNARRAALISLINSSTSADFIIPMGSDALLGPDSASSAGIYYRADQVHFTPAGATQAAQVAKTAIDSYLTSLGV